MSFIKKTFPTTVLIFSILLLIYTFYKSEIFWDGDKRNSYVIYYFISLVLIILSIITFFINEKLKEYFIIFSITTVFSLYLCESYLTFKDHSFFKKFSKNQFLRKQHYSNQTGDKWDSRTLFEAYKDLKKNNIETVMDIGRNYFTIENNLVFALSAIENAPTVYCNENGYYSSYISDRYGFNNPDEEWENREIEYLLVGDSFAHGLCVNRPHDIASVLRILSNKNVINLGWRGNGPLSEYAILREYLNPNVKKIIWIYYEGNDLLDLDNEMQNKILTSYIDNRNFSQNLKFKTKVLKEKKMLTHKYIEKLLNDRFFNFVKLYNLRLFIRNQIFIYKFHSAQKKRPDTRLENFQKIIKLVKNLIEKNNSKLYFVYLPEYSRYLKTYDNKNYNSVKSIIDDLNIPFIDMTKIFEKEKDPLKLFPFGFDKDYNVKGDKHYNIEGYKKVAENIYKFFEK